MGQPVAAEPSPSPSPSPSPAPDQSPDPSPDPSTPETEVQDVVALKQQATQLSRSLQEVEQREIKGVRPVCFG
jgi:hypothetical protein